MGRFLVLTADLPFFPGKMGVDFFNLRHLATRHDVAVVAPCYENYPPEGVTNLESFLSATYFWPRPVGDVPLIATSQQDKDLRRWVYKIPHRLRKWALMRILKLQNKPSDSFEKLAILANCAPQLLHALIKDGPWQAIILIQSSIEPWLDYLPASTAKFVYFHDVRSDYLSRSNSISENSSHNAREIKSIFSQEQSFLLRTEVAGFVSDLDLKRAGRLFKTTAETGVAPIPVDTDYYIPAPNNHVKDSRKVILFTGHLSHPPNVDAVLYFLGSIWPLVLKEIPDALFKVVGMSPDTRVRQAIESSDHCELHANVPDIRPYFWDANVYIVPMRYGGGVRQKIFEAWSMKVPVVCTGMAAEGTGAIHGTHCWMEDTPQKFASRVAGVLNGYDTKIILKSAKEYVGQVYSVPSAAGKFKRLAEKSILIKKKKPYKLLYDLRWMEIGRAGGMEQATYELISAISQLDFRNEYRMFAPQNTASEWLFPRHFRSKMIYSDHHSRQIEHIFSMFANKLSQSIQSYPLLTPYMRSLSTYKKLDFDLVHSVCGYTHPDLIGFPGILTVNDLQHLHFPGFFSKAELEEREALYRESVSRAKHIVCISEYTRQDVHKHYGISLEKMSAVWVIPTKRAWFSLPEKILHTLLSGMNINESFFFFPAHGWPHKNHKNLVKAFQMILPELPTEVKLVFTGRPFPDDHPAAVLIADYGLQNRIIHLGYRSPIEVRALLQSCLALVFPSLFEGFGIPVAEAIIARKPVLCSNTSSLPEVAGDAAITFNPEDPNEIAKCLLRLANDEMLRKELSEASANRRHVFSARKSAVQTLSVYQRVYDEFYTC